MNESGLSCRARTGVHNAWHIHCKETDERYPVMFVPSFEWSCTVTAIKSWGFHYSKGNSTNPSIVARLHICILMNLKVMHLSMWMHGSLLLYSLLALGGLGFRMSNRRFSDKLHVQVLRLAWAWEKFCDTVCWFDGA